MLECVVLLLRSVVFEGFLMEMRGKWWVIGFGKGAVGGRRELNYRSQQTSFL